jgi:transcription elongation GreA/GreB family factor
MSRAFVSEDVIGSAGNELPERPISDRPNLVTRRGRHLIDHRVHELQRALEALAPDDDDHRPSLLRDLRYWAARQASARVVELPEGPIDEVRFGTVVTLRTADGGLRRYRLVGEDEADPDAGLLNWSAPLARGLLGAAVGDVVDFDGTLPSVEVVDIDRPEDDPPEGTAPSPS